MPVRLPRLTAGLAAPVHLRRLAVTDFRSWEAAELDLTPGVTVLVGPNGVGKTNLVEAAGYLATLGSHRVATDAPLIRRGAERAVVRGHGGAPGPRAVGRAGDHAGAGQPGAGQPRAGAKPRDVLGILRTVLFAPEDLALVRGDPGERRRFLDDLLVARYPRYAAVRADYDRVLRQRAALLKTARGRAATCAPSTSGTATSPRHGAALLAGRLELVAAIAPARGRGVRRGRAVVAEPIALVYRCSVEHRRRAPLEAALLEALARVRRQEVERGVCLVGPHRDDLELRLGDGPAKGYASHGESWALALALRLASYRLLRDDDVEPVLILDDVFAELDARRRRALAEVARRAEQVLVTAAVDEDVPAALDGVRFTVGGGRAWSGAPQIPRSEA